MHLTGFEEIGTKDLAGGVFKLNAKRSSATTRSFGFRISYRKAGRGEGFEEINGGASNVIFAILI